MSGKLAPSSDEDNNVYETITEGPVYEVINVGGKRLMRCLLSKSVLSMM